MQLEEYWGHKGRVVLKFTGVDSISDAQTLVGLEIQIPLGERAGLEPGAAYISDLKGCLVLVTEGPGQREIGCIADVKFGAGEAPLLVIREGDGERAKEYLVPFAREYVVSTDLSARQVVLSLPEGMLDLDAPLSGEEKRRTKPG